MKRLALRRNKEQEQRYQHTATTDSYKILTFYQASPLFSSSLFNLNLPNSLPLQPHRPSIQQALTNLPASLTHPSIHPSIHPTKTTHQPLPPSSSFQTKPPTPKMCFTWKYYSSHPDCGHYLYNQDRPCMQKRFKPDLVCFYAVRRWTEDVKCDKCRAKERELREMMRRLEVRN